jgi:hypothetical protein
MSDLYKAAVDMLDRYISLAESGEIHWKSNQEKEAIALLKALMDKPCKTGSQCIGGKCPGCEREWVGLTDAEVIEMAKSSDIWGGDISRAILEFAASIEIKLEEKNSV